jgi:hypothetical protein
VESNEFAEVAVSSEDLEVHLLALRRGAADAVDDAALGADAVDAMHLLAEVRAGLGVVNPAIDRSVSLLREVEVVRVRGPVDVDGTGEVNAVEAVHLAASNAQTQAQRASVTGVKMATTKPSQKTVRANVETVLLIVSLPLQIVPLFP